MRAGFKRAVAVILSVVLIVATASCISALAVSEINFGDTNNDGFVNICDATLIQKVINGAEMKDEYDFYAFDVYQDENIDVRDVTVLQKYIAGIYTELPVFAETTPTEEVTNPTVPTQSTTSDGWNDHVVKP